MQFLLQSNHGILLLPLYRFVVAVASPLSLVDGVAFAVLSDVLSVPRFLVVVFSVSCAEFQVGVLFPEEFRWKSSPASISSHLVNPALLCLLFCAFA